MYNFVRIRREIKTRNWKSDSELCRLFMSSTVNEGGFTVVDRGFRKYTRFALLPTWYSHVLQFCSSFVPYDVSKPEIVCHWVQKNYYS